MSPPPAPPPPGDVLVVCCEAEQARSLPPGFAQWLSADDARRFSTMAAEPVRLAFAAGRALIGWLDRAAHGTSAGPDLAAGPHGKPSFRRATPWRFSLSHAAGRVVLAVTSGRELGVDVESSRRPGDYAALSRRAFHPREREWWESRGSTPADFLRLWTLKEAWLKTGGEGITVELRALDVTPWLAGVPRDGRTAAFPDIGTGHVAAVVVEGPLRAVHVADVSIQDLIVPGDFPGYSASHE